MTTRYVRLIARLAAAVVVLCVVPAHAEEMSTAFTYQGRLLSGGHPANGPHHMAFALHSHATNDSPVGAPIVLPAVQVAEGLFTVHLDFGAMAFNGDARWLHIVVNEVSLTPRQLLTAAPQSLQTRGLFVDGNLRVGVGTLAPSRKLSVAAGAVVDQEGLQNGTFATIGERALSFGGPTTGELITSNRTPGSVNQYGLDFYTNSFSLQPRMSITNAGFVGIGTNTPQAALDVRSQTLPQIRFGLPGGNVGQLISGTNGVVIATNDGVYRLWINQVDGRVGMGTTEPNGGLHVRREPLSAGGTFAIEGNTHAYMSFFPQGAGGGRRAYFGFAGGGASSLTIANENVSGNIILDTGAPFGRVGVNVTNPFYALELPNIADVAVGGARAWLWSTYSSRRWKQNVRPIPNALELALRLEGVLFDWKAEHGGASDIGFIAEDVAAVVPELVSMEPGGEDAAAMKYDRVAALAIEAIKELHERLTEKDAEIHEMRARLDLLERIISGLLEPEGRR